jgi:hypothetical protein
MPHSIPEIPVIYFHSVAPKKNPTWVRNFLTLDLRYFEDFLKNIRKNGWETIFLNEYYLIKKSGKKPKGKICCITFDDGFIDNYIYAYPLLKKYGLRGTIFVNPEFIDLRREVAMTLEDVWANRADLSDIEKWGYLVWDELRLMQQSNVMDIQSHTMTHTKLFISDEIVSFHRPGADCLYPIGNIFPERKPYCINDKEFERLIPYGTPFFKSTSAVIARQVIICKEFDHLISEMLSDIQWEQSDSNEKAFNVIRSEYMNWKSKNKIIESIETTQEYEKRLYSEIVQSKTTIEKELKKKVEFLCWPHGENNEFVHQFAINNGYLATTTGSKQKITASPNRIPIRTSIGVVNNSLFLTNMKTRYRMSIAGGNPSMKLIQKIVQKIK